MSQDEYIEILFQDLGFNVVTRRAYLQDYGVNYSDELPSKIKSQIIDDLKERKDNR